MVCLRFIYYQEYGVFFTNNVTHARADQRNRLVIHFLIDGDDNTCASMSLPLYLYMFCIGFGVLAIGQNIANSLEVNNNQQCM